MENTCDASSRVGVTISTRMRFRLAFLYLRVTVGLRGYRRRSRMGSKYAAVLPLPVLAAAQMSRPASASGMQRACE